MLPRTLLMHSCINSIYYDFSLVGLGVQQGDEPSWDVVLSSCEVIEEVCLWNTLHYFELHLLVRHLVEHQLTHLRPLEFV